VFITKQKKKLLQENAKKLIPEKGGTRRRNANRQDQETKIPMIEVNNGDGSTQKKSDHTTVIENNITIKNLDEITRDVLERESFDDAHLIAKEPNPYITVVQNLFEYEEEFVCRLLQAMIRNADGRIKEGLVGSFGEFEVFISLLTTLLENIEPESEPYALFIKFISKIGSELMEDQPGITTLYIESIAMDFIVEMAKTYSNKKDALAHIIVCFTPSSPQSRLRILEKLAFAFKTDVRNYAALLAHLSVYHIGEGCNDQRLTDFYWMKAMHIIEYSYPKMKACGLKILNEFSKDNTYKMFISIENIKKLADDPWWEIKAQILIICSNQLEFINTRSDEFESTIAQMQGKAKSKIEGNHGASQIAEQNEEFVERDGDFLSPQETKEGYVQTLLDLMDQIFHIHADVNVQKVGLIYIAKILRHYPILCKRYLEVLLVIHEDIMRTILSIEEVEIESYIVLSKNLNLQ